MRPSIVLFSRSCVRESVLSGVLLRTCKLQSKSAHTRNEVLDFPFGNVSTAEFEPRCQVAHMSQIIASVRPLVFGMRRCKWKGTMYCSSRNAIKTPSDRLLFVTARKSQSCQSAISSGTNRSSRRNRNDARAVFKSCENSSRSILFIPSLYGSYDVFCKNSLASSGVAAAITPAIGSTRQSISSYISPFSE